MTQPKHRTVQDLMETVIDYRGKTPPKTTSGVPLITAKVIKDGRVNDNKHEFIAESYYDEWMRRGLPKQWDVLITTEAPLGEVAILRTPERVALAQRVILLRGNPALLDQRYLCFALQAPFTQGELARRASGTTVLGIRQSELRHVRIPWFPIAAQRKIASILAAYDDLMENNLRRIRILEEMARLIYREWFVEFRFPGHQQSRMVGSALGAIPDGWSVGAFADVARPSRDLVAPADFGDAPIAHYSFAAYDEGGLPTIEETTSIKSSKFAIGGECVLLAKLNPRIPRVWLPDLRDPERALASSEFLVLIPTVPATSSYLYALCGSEAFLKRFAGRAVGTSTSHQRVKPDDLFSLPIVIPPAGLVADFVAKVGDMFDLVSVLRRANRNLRITRDLLLPRLISGELDISELEIAPSAEEEATL